MRQFEFVNRFWIRSQFIHFFVDQSYITWIMFGQSGAPGACEMPGSLWRSLRNALIQSLFNSKSIWSLLDFQSIQLLFLHQVRKELAKCLGSTTVYFARVDSPSRILNPWLFLNTKPLIIPWISHPPQFNKTESTMPREHHRVLCARRHPQPYTLHPTPNTLYPIPYTLHTTHYTLNPQS